MADIKIYGALTCASGDRLTNAKEIRDDAMQEFVGSSTSPTQAEINEKLAEHAQSIVTPYFTVYDTSIYTDSQYLTANRTAFTELFALDSGDGLRDAIIQVQEADNKHYVFSNPMISGDIASAACVINKYSGSGDSYIARLVTCKFNVSAGSCVVEDKEFDTDLFVLVTTLPTSDIKDNKIYLVPGTETTTNNIYTEYMYVNSSWEIVGQVQAEVDLSAYAKTEDVNTQLSTKQDKLTQGDNITIEGNVISAVDTTYDVATTSANGLMSSTDKTKLDSINEGAEENQNTFHEVEVTSGGATTTITAVDKEDTLTLVAGNGISLEGDSNNRNVTINASSSVNDSTITIKQAGENKGTFTLNASSDKTITVDAGSTVALYTYSTAKSKWDNLQQGEYAMFVYYDTAGYGTISGDEATWLFGSSDSVGISSGDLLCVVKNTVLNLAGTHALKIPLQDAKAASGDFPGADGLETVYDKTQVNKIPTIESDVANALSLIDTSCFRCYSGEYNMNYCGWYGYYMYGTLGRPAGSSDGEYYVLRVANGGTDGDYVVLEQTAYSCQDAGRVFRRIVKTKDRSAMDTDGNTTWGEWTQLATTSDLTSLEATVDTLDGLGKIYTLSDSASDNATMFTSLKKGDIVTDPSSSRIYVVCDKTSTSATIYGTYLGDSMDVPTLGSVGTISSDGTVSVTDYTIPNATPTSDGFMSKEDKAKLDNINEDSLSIQVVTEEEYAALEDKDATTIYFIVGDTTESSDTSEATT